MRGATLAAFLGALLLAVWMPDPASAFCGFYVAKADAGLFNEASQVVLVRHDGKTVITMVSDFKGDPTEFALVVPVPTFIERGQIHVADMALIDHLDAYTSPRLVEYFDEDPCLARLAERARKSMLMLRSAGVADRHDDARELGVTIEASYTVGEYDILLLSAQQSDGLETWLTRNGYTIPRGATSVLASYIKQGMRFFVAKVNLEQQAALGFQTLRPLQVAYETPKFMLPIRLGTVNANGPQELIVYALTRSGRVETTNYRTVKLPSNLDVPTFVKDDFAGFYTDMFSEQVRKESMRTVFLEYAWDMAWCDPCAASPLSPEQLRGLGVFWLDDTAASVRGGGQARDVFVTRLHVRYDAKHFPADLIFQETGDRQNFQGRYVLHHPWTGEDTCDARESYKAALRERQEAEAANLAMLTGWSINDIRHRMALGDVPPPAKSWWEKLWGSN